MARAINTLTVPIQRGNGNNRGLFQLSCLAALERVITTDNAAKLEKEFEQVVHFSQDADASHRL